MIDKLRIFWPNFRLALEWNSLGLMDTYAFSQFCESLGMNKSIKDLDLRNNQITHTSALELCAAIEVNTALQSLGKKNSHRQTLNNFILLRVMICFVKILDGIVLDWLVVKPF